MKKVRALHECFVLGTRWKVGREFNVPDDTVLQTKKMAPVMELVDAEPSRVRSKGGTFRKRAKKPDEPAED